MVDTLTLGKRSNFKSIDFLSKIVALLQMQCSRDGDNVFFGSLKAEIQYVQFIEKVFQKRNYKPLVSSLSKNETISTQKNNPAFKNVFF
jgi:hypothetical protein